MLKKEIFIENQKIWAFLPETSSPELTVFYTFPNDENEALVLAEKLPENAACVAIFEPNWEQHFTPWAAPRLFKKGADFAGGAAQYHADLCQRIPQIEQMCGIQAACRGILGYSLAGLFAVYNAITAPYFDLVASVSGSLWFDDWLNFIAENRPKTLPQAIYFSVGDTEAHSKNPRTAQVQSATEQTFAYWQTLACPATFEINAGGHFDDVPQRVAKAAHWLTQHRKK